MHRIQFLLAILLVAIVPHVHAAESYDNCTGFIDALPATIGSQGTWCLNHNLGTAITSGRAIEVTTNNVTIDCNGFKIGGLAAGFGTATYGIYANDRFNLTVRNCNIRGFERGIITIGGGGHLIEDNGLDANTYMAIYVRSPGSTIRNNRVVDTGGSTAVPGAAYGIYATRGVDVIDNTVSGVAAEPDSGGQGTSYGIYTYYNNHGSVVGNRVRELAGSGTGEANGIYTMLSGRIIVRDNDVQDGSGDIGIHCTDGKATARDNIVTGFVTGIDNCWSYGNAVNSN